jgi:glycosyltransferase involved in cell wall biosynthesis
MTRTAAQRTTFGFDGLRLQGQRFGIGRYIEYVLKHMDRALEPSERVIVYVREPWDKNELGLSDAFEVKVLPSRLDGVWWEHYALAKHWRETDVMFCPSYTVPLNYRGRLVVATHSVNEKVSGTHSWWYHLTYRPRNKLSARKADAVIVPSETARTDVQELYGVRADKIAVVPEGVDDEFMPVQDVQTLREVRQLYLGGDFPYILFVGKFSQRRNIPALVEAFASVKRTDGIPHKLLLYGKNVHNLPIDVLARDLGVADSVVQLNESLPDHRAIIPIYSGADLFVHPTAYEGFSLTICEAMACGTPVITVGRGAVAEIVNGAAYTVTEPTPEQLASAIRTVLGDRDLQASLRAKALDQVSRFRFSETARGTLEVMRRVAAV